MPLLSSAMPNLVNGVSQQAPALRQSSQLEAQENAYSSVVEGLGKRAPTHHIKRLDTDDISDAFIHTINRDLSERYKVVLTDGNLRVFTLLGVEKDVAFPDGTTYLDTATPNTVMRALTVEDYTFIVNTGIEATMDASLSSDPGVQGLVFIKSGQYSTTYKVFVDDVEQASTTTSASDVSNLRTTTIASALAAQLVTNLGGTWTITVQDSCILVKKVAGTAFKLRTQDSFGDRAMIAFKDTIQRFSDLPTIAPTDYVVKILGDNSLSQDDYYVKFSPNNAGDTFDKGNWIETVAPGIAYKLDAATMPHILVREEDGTFTFKEATWGQRAAGDTDSAPDPSFVGSTVNDVFFFLNRLGFLSDENVIMSVSGSFFDYFPETVVTVLDSAPIDIAATHTKASNLQYAIPFQEELLLFSDQAQFILSGGSLLTSTSVQVNQTTEFLAALRCRPIGAGNNIYFPFPHGSFAGIKEYFIQSNNDSKDAADITAHVAKYIPSAITSLSAATNENLLVALSSGDTESLYVYKYYWVNDQKLQSSWSKFFFEADCNILNAEFIESTLYMIIQRTDGWHMEKMVFDPGQTDESSDFVLGLDRRLTEADVTIAYDSPTNTTTWTLPYEITGTMKIAVRAGDDDLAEGTNINLQAQTGNEITALGDYTGTKVFIGQTYTMTVEFSEQVMREQAQGGGQSIINAGRLQLRYFTVGFNDTGYFNTEVTPTGRDTSEKAFTGLTLGVDAAGVVNLSKGKYRFPIFAQSNQVIIKLTSDSYLPCHFTSAEYEGFYSGRSQRA